MTNSAAQPRGLHLWWVAIRPKTLGLAISPVIIGAALAWSSKGTVQNPEVPWLILLCAIAIQAATNLFNDVKDHLNGTDTADRVGPPRITALGWALPHQVSIGALTICLIALLGGFHLVTIGGWPIFFGGLAALWAGYLYSNGPYPISRSPFGEVVVIAFFGLFAVIGTVYLMSGTFGPDAIIWGLIMGLPGGAVLLLNNIRDYESDRRAGRRTLAILMGPQQAPKLYGALVLLPYVLIVVGAIFEWIPIGTTLGIVTMLFAIRNIQNLASTPHNVELNPLLGATVKCQTLTAIMAALGLLFVNTVA
ncbi:MAG: 1,4-dihydroxy-2-naphthoate octaprenyltransferase [Magnetovibrio sp.]|nr:1,4-dihydroxy-2-naphthoate octaprenyltransferase [Magnetovibrio sp.]